jgi:hypothetical protein
MNAHLPTLGPNLAADWLSLAAAPTFVIMSLLTRVLGSDMLCSVAPAASPLTGMAAMYLLMSAFHSGPWLRLVFRQRSLPWSPAGPRRA